VRAAVTATTRAVPRLRSAAAAAARVAPVVATSSTTSTQWGNPALRAPNRGPARRTAAG
jgi:hypothetical protein